MPGRGKAIEVELCNQNRLQNQWLEEWTDQALVELDERLLMERSLHCLPDGTSRHESTDQHHRFDLMDPCVQKCSVRHDGAVEFEYSSREIGLAVGTCKSIESATSISKLIRTTKCTIAWRAGSHWSLQRCADLLVPDLCHMRIWYSI